MKRLNRGARKCLAASLCWFGSCSLLGAQEASIEPVQPSAPFLWRPYLAVDVPQIRLTDSSRLQQLVRAGTLYLTVSDAIALALENNVDIEVARYDPISLAWQVTRAEAGGALPGVPSGASQTTSVASGQGVLGSQAAAGVSISGSNGVVSRTVNATITQVGPVTQTLDPSIQEATTFSHRSIPQPNAVQSLTPVLVQDQRIYTGSYQEGFLSGGNINISYNNHYLSENSPTDVLNPSVAPTLSFTFAHNLLQGFGVAVNARTINVAKLNLRTSDLNFKTQLVTVVSNVLNAYYALVGDLENSRAKRADIAAAERFYAETKRRADLGAAIDLDVDQAQSQLAASRQSLVDADVSQRKDEIQLKNLISREGIGNPLVTALHVVPLQQIEIPGVDDLPDLKALVAKALANRSDLLAEKVSIQGSEINAVGTRNGLLPTLQAIANGSNAGTAGVPRVVPTPQGIQTADPYFVGGIGTALGQVFRRNFPSESAGAFILVPLRNRQSQADDGITQLQLRQQQLTTEKDLKQLQVDLMNAVSTLRQARVRYEAALSDRTLKEQLAKGEQRKYELGESTSYNVVTQQRDYEAAQATEIAALVSYQSARTSLDQALGTTLETNHVAIGEAKAGQIAAKAALPVNLPSAP